MADSEEMRELLTYANYAKVADALRVSRNSVSQWAKGKDVTPYRVRQVRDLLRPTAPTEPAPAWAERLLAGMMSLETKSEISEVEKDRAAALAAAWLATEEQRKQHRPGGGAAGGASNA